MTNDIQVVEENYNTYAGNQDKWTKNLIIANISSSHTFFLKIVSDFIYSYICDFAVIGEQRMTLNNLITMETVTLEDLVSLMTILSDKGDLK